MNKTSLFFFLFLLWACDGKSQATAPYEQEGEASYYANVLHGRKTASGELYLKDSLTAAHNTLPFGTRIKVTNQYNDRSVIVKINDRGPFVKGRIIDLSRAAASKLGFIKKGKAWVKIKVVEAASGYSLSDSLARP